MSHTTKAELELAFVHLLRAAELARFFQHSQELVERIELLKRATVRVRKELEAVK
jgi:hypothetical protein